MRESCFEKLKSSTDAIISNSNSDDCDDNNLKNKIVNQNDIN